MPDSFDLSFLGADYYALLPDYSANALWAGRPEKIPAGLYHMRITDTRSSLLRGREYLVFSLLILEGARRGRTIDIACFYRSDGTWPGMEAVCGNGGNAGSGQSGMPDSASGEESPVSRPGCGSASGDSGSAEENPYLREGGDWRDDDGGADAYSTGSASPAGTCGSASRLRFGKEARA